MATAAVSEPALAVGTANPPVQHFVLDSVSWNQFLKLTEALGERSGLRVAYDGDRLELMTLSRRHERWKKILGQLIEQLTLELDIPRESGGQTTFRSELVERGVEPDQCYWIEHAGLMVGVDDWEARVHPAPDLAVEIDVSHSSIDRQEIYAKLGVPELWRFDGRTLKGLALTESGTYQAVEHSLAFPFLRVTDLQPFLVKDPPVSETAVMQEFTAWVRSQGFPKT